MQQDPIQLDPQIRSLLDQLRRGIRSYVWMEGFAVALLWVGVAFWVSLLFDWWLEPPVAVRVTAIAVFVVVLVGIIYTYVLCRAFVPLANSSMALLLERRFTRFDGSLLTTVELSEYNEHAADFRPEMLAAARHKAVREIPHIDVRQVFRHRPITSKIGIVSVLFVSILVFGLLASSAFATWLDRNLLLSSVPWPRKTRIVVEGFDSGVVKVARGSDLQIVVKADTSKELVPESVRLRYVQEDTTGQELMTRVGEALNTDEPYQRFTYTFKSILSPIKFEVRGGDDRVRDLLIQPVESPLLTEMQLRLDFPRYMGRSSRTDRVSGIMQIPIGSELTVLAEANKPLTEVTVHRLLGDKTELLTRIEPFKEDRAKLEFDVGDISGDQTLLLSLLDTDGIQSREPVRLLLAGVADEPPKLNVRLRSIGEAITPQASLPVAGEISDDYGVSKVWFDYAVADASPQQQEMILGDPTNRIVYEGRDVPTLDARDLNLSPGQSLHVAVKASDNYALGEQPNTASSERYKVEVVSGPQLLAILEARELMLRRRLETLIEVMTQMRASLTATAGTLPSSATSVDAAATSALPVTADSQLVEIRRAIADCEHSEHETAALAVAFYDIHEELQNNRLDATEKQARLVDGIAKPLTQLAEKHFPELSVRLNRLQEVHQQADAGSTRRNDALAQCDAILVELSSVLEQMLKLEDLNQLVELLRDVIELQDDLNAETSRQQKEKARDLLE